MQITTTDLSMIKKFKEDLSDYHDLANMVFAVSSGREYMSDDEFNKLRKRERALRDDLNEQYGAVEKHIIAVLGGKPLMGIPAFPGRRWDVFAEALSSNFNITKGDCLNMAEDEMSRVYGKAKSLVDTKSDVVGKNGRWFPEDLLIRISDQKIRKLCEELDRVFLDNPNAAALLVRTILLITLQKKLGKKAHDDLGPVLNQAISQDIYGDLHIKRILQNLASVPKTMLDATHHSKWVLIKTDDLGIWLPGLVNIIEATYPKEEI